MFKHWPLPFISQARRSAPESSGQGEWVRWLSTDQLQLGAVVITGLGLLVVWLWWLQVHSLI